MVIVITLMGMLPWWAARPLSRPAEVLQIRN